MERTQITIFMNGDVTRECKVTLNTHTTLKDIISQCSDEFAIPGDKRCILFEPSGEKLTEDDVEFLDSGEPLYLSQGEPLAKNASFALYEEVWDLGEGGFGCVKKYINKFTGNEVAIKFMDFRSAESPEDIQRIFSEINLLRGLSHPNIVNLVDAFPLGQSMTFVMELCGGGEL